MTTPGYKHPRGFAVLQIIWVLAGLRLLRPPPGKWFATRATAGMRKSPSPLRIRRYCWRMVRCISGSSKDMALRLHAHAVFYIVSQTNTETKQTANVLVKRGKKCTNPTACTSTLSRSYPSSR